MRRFLLSASLAVLACTVSWAGAAAEAAGSSTRGKYLAGQGIIVPPDQVLVDSYIASIDYHYPKPATGVGVSLYIGHQQVSSDGQEEIVHIGIQGPESRFEELAPMNLVFVIDHSGSMGDKDKLEWVKRAFDVFIARVRDKDFVSLVVFENSAQVLFPSTQMNSEAKRQRFRDVVRGLSPGDGTDLLAGLKRGYEQAMTNFRTDYTNRVLFLTDGNDNADHVRQMLEMAESYRQMGINVSTIGVGESFDLKLMNDLAARGGGSSRFISDMKEMEQMFGSDLDRMVVPAAREVSMTLQFAPEVEILGTWGYENAIRGTTITYTIPTLHHRDYETILALVRIPPIAGTGRKTLASFSLTYRDLQGGAHSQGPYPLEVEIVGGQSPLTGFSDGTVLKSGTMLRFAQALVRIGQAYYSGRSDTDAINTLRNQAWQKLSESERKGTDPLQLSSPEIRERESALQEKMKRCLDMSLEMRKELANARLRLDDTGFDEQIGIMEKYIQILGKELALKDEETSRISRDEEISPPVPQRSLEENLGNLFREILLEMNATPGGTIAVSGFTMKRESQPQLVTLLNERGLVELTKVDQLKVVERQKLDAVLREQELALSDLMDTGKAISVGKILSARYILTGSVIEMPTSVVIFARIVNVETAEVESAAQVIVPKDREVSSLL